MKKIISILCAILILFSLLGFTTFAKNIAITISEDYQTLTVDGETYSRFNTSKLRTTLGDFEQEISLSEVQKETVESAYVLGDKNKNLIHAYIEFKDGANLQVAFMRDDCRETYEQLLNDKSLDYEIDFLWPEENIITTRGEDLFGKTVTLEDKVLEESKKFDVTVRDSKENLIVVKGALLMYEKDFYYVDYVESNLDKNMQYKIHEVEGIVVHKISDKKLNQKLDVAREEYLDTEFGFLEDTDFTETVSALFLIFTFGLIPFVGLCLFLIFAICSKSKYKKLFRATYVLCSAELVIFIIVAVLIIGAKMSL